MRRASLSGVLAAVAVVMAAITSNGASGASPPPPPPCYGAAARDAAHPCTNPALRAQVVPAPDDAPLIPDAPCEPLRRDAALGVCAFGERTAARTIALLGDSHASGWRAALIAAGEPGHWHGVSLTKSSCPFTRAQPRIAAPARAACRRHNDEVVAWLTAHPEVHDVFVSAHAGAPVIRRRGRRSLASKIAGYREAWAALPASVRRIVVLRDGPTHPWRTAACINAALAKQRPSMPACAVRRAGALLPDAQVVSARRLRTARVRVIDLTSFMCGPRRCYPVVGGVLVNRDTNHLSRAFSATLGPYVLRRALPFLTPAGA